MFVDEAELYVESGRGGNGCVSFRREKYRPHGGPDGGDGGAGGSVILRATPGKSTLSEFRRRKHFRAKNGWGGGSSNRTGRTAGDLVIGVPAGTVVKDQENKVLADLAEPGMSFKAARGGRGGKGNASLVSMAGPLPGFAEKGEPGESTRLRLELKLVADVALVGFPNAGKSTLISRISRARPKIADYPFTTTEPNLGVVESERNSYVVTDVPGLVDGAHAGKGMGTDFLRHIERALIILYLIDASPFNERSPAGDLVSLENELRLYNPELMERRRLVVANKMDLSPDEEDFEFLKRECETRGLAFYPVSAITGEGLDRLLKNLEVDVSQAREQDILSAAEVTYSAEPTGEVTRVTRSGNRFLVEGRTVERMVLMTDWSNPEARQYLSRRLKRTGVEEMLTGEGAESGVEVEIAGRVFEFIPEGEEGEKKDD